MPKCTAGLLLLFVQAACAQVTATGSQTLRIMIAPNAKMTVVQSSIILTSPGQLFGNFTGTATLNYKIRTTINTGSSNLSVSATGEFSPSTGPKISDQNLTYTCSPPTLGTSCSGSQTVSTAFQTGVLAVGSGACTGAGCAGADPNSVVLNFSLSNDPGFKTGNYSTGLIFTISSI